MSRSNGSSLGMHEHQAEFIYRFVSGQLGRGCVLESIPQVGKMSAALAVVARLIEEQGRALILGRTGALLQQAGDRLLGLGVSTRILDRGLARELLFGEPETVGMPSTGALTCTHALIRFADVVEALAGIQWRVIVVDDADQLGNNAVQAVARIVMGSPHAKLLLLSVPGGRPFSPELGSLSVVRWDYSYLLRRHAPSEFQVLEYERRPDEIAFLKKLRARVERESSEQSEALLRRASSSLLALDRALLAGGEHAPSFESISEELALVSSDAKLDALIARIRGTLETRVVVCGFEETAEYVRSALASRDVSSGNMEEAAGGLLGAKERERTVVTTYEDLNSVGALDCDELIHYDLPQKLREIISGNAHLFRGPRPSWRFVVFADRSGVLPNEASQLVSLRALL